jgi:cellulose synthase/poly-beta-1,6-N-acetylglucosamine synthase-like glycosyltransferase
LYLFPISCNFQGKEDFVIHQTEREHFGKGGLFAIPQFSNNSIIIPCVTEQAVFAKNLKNTSKRNGE